MQWSDNNMSLPNTVLFAMHSRPTSPHLGIVTLIRKSTSTTPLYMIESSSALHLWARLLLRSLSSMRNSGNFGIRRTDTADTSLTLTATTNRNYSERYGPPGRDVVAHNTTRWCTPPSAPRHISLDYGLAAFAMEHISMLQQSGPEQDCVKRRRLTSKNTLMPCPHRQLLPRFYIPFDHALVAPTFGRRASLVSLRS